MISCCLLWTNRIRTASIFCWLLAPLSPVLAEAPHVTATAPASLTVHVSAGELTVPDTQKTVTVIAGDLSFDPPELREYKGLENKGESSPAPPDLLPAWSLWNSWPGKGLIHLAPRYQDGTLVLGGLFRTFRDDSFRVASADGQTVYARGVDYVTDPDWGTVANKDGHLKGSVIASAKGALQRLDLIQVSVADGKVSVKQGKPLMVAPDLPEADQGHVPLAGIYVAPWPAARNPFFDADPAGISGATEYAITPHEICPVQPLPPVPPIHPERLAHTLAKLRGSPAQGSDSHPEEVRIAFMGDSITLGAEASMWYLPEIAYGPKDKTYRGRLMYQLRQRFPKVSIKPIEAYKGGTGIELAVGDIDKLLAEKKPDLVIIAFGGNDINGPAGGSPHTPVDKFCEHLETLVEKIHAANSEALLVTCFPLNPWLRTGMTQRQPAYNAALKDAAEAKGAAVADVYTEYSHLGSHGIPPWSTLHNWINHPNDQGHALYTEQLLAFFPSE